MEAIVALLTRKKGVMLFTPYCNGFAARHSCKKLDGRWFPCENKEEAIEFMGDLMKSKGELDPHTAGIMIIGGPKIIETITMDCVKKFLKEQAGKKR